MKKYGNVKLRASDMRPEIVISAKAKRRMQSLYAVDREPLAKCFIPKGRSAYQIYAVSVKDHPDKVKVGRTQRWHMRRLAYSNWNLATSDAVMAEEVFNITEEFVDLPKLEAHILANLGLQRAFGQEWFFGNVEDTARIIDRLLCESGLSFTY